MVEMNLRNSTNRLSIKVFITNMSAERLLDIENPIPSHLQISVNVNILGINKMSETSLKAPYVFTVNFTPSIAQISIKGHAQAIGRNEEIERLFREHSEEKKVPTPVIQAISNITIAEAILISKTLGIPPPLPPMTPSGGKIQRKTDDRYTA